MLFASCVYQLNEAVEGVHVHAKNLGLYSRYRYRHHSAQSIRKAVDEIIEEAFRPHIKDN